jgi:hypothetical protein
VDRQNSVGAVVFARQQNSRFRSKDLFSDPVELARQLLIHRLAFRSELEQGFEVGLAAHQLLVRFQNLF